MGFGNRIGRENLYGEICMVTLLRDFVSKICMGKFVSGNLYGDFVKRFANKFCMVVQVHKSIGYTSSISGSDYLTWDLEIGLVKRNCMVKFVWEICMVDLYGRIC